MTRVPRSRACRWMLWVFLSGLLASSAVAQQHERGQDKSESLTLTGKLVDATWFEPHEDDAETERLKRASANLAGGIPAAVLPEDAEEEKDLWILLANSASLAPYAGKHVKVEGRIVTDVRGIVPTAVYVSDEDKWRQVQLTVPPEEPMAVEPLRAEQSSPHDEHELTAEPEHQHDGGHPAPEESASETSGDEHAHDHHEHWLSFELAHVHPILVNFTAGLFPAAVLSDWLGRLMRRRSLKLAAWWMLLFAAITTPFTALAGWLWLRQAGDMGHPQMLIHPWLGLALAISLPLLALWRGRSHKHDGDPSSIYLITATAVLLALMLQGNLGGTMSFSAHTTESGRGAHAH